MNAFWLSLGLTFWAEMGDKTQFVAVAYATRYSFRDVMLGILWATAAVHLVSVGLGGMIAAWIPLGYIQAISAISFVGFALWTIRGDEKPEALQEKDQHPILLVGITFFLAELGDKTMLTATTLATTHGWLGVWLGTTVGMVAADGLAVWVGGSLGKEIPEKTVKWISAALFLAFGAWYGYKALLSFH